MEEELKELLAKAREGGASKEQLQGIVDSYRAKQEPIPKGESAEGSGESVSASANTDSLSDSKDTRTLVEKIDDGEIDTTYNPDPDGILANLPDRGLAFKDEAARKLKGFYDAAGVKDYTIDNTTITHEALRIKANLEKEEKDRKDWEDWDFWSESWKKVKANTNRAIGGLTGFPNFLNKTFFTISASKEMKEYANTLDPKMREIFINAVMYNPVSNPASGLGQVSADAQEKFLGDAKAIEEEMVQLDGYITDDFASGDVGKGTLRVLSEGIGSIPSLVQAMVPYVGLGSIAAGAAANKQEELEEEGYGIGLDTTFNSIINGTAESLSEIYTRKLGGKLFKSLKGTSPATSKKAFETIKEHLIKAPLYEGGSEGATALIQNLSDMYVQGKEKEFNDVWKEVSDAFLIGFGTGKGIGTTTYVTETSRNLVEDVNTQKILKSENNDFNNLKDAFNPELPQTYSLDQLKLANYKSNNNRLSRELDKEVKSGDMTKEEASAYEHKYNETVSALRKTQGVKMTDEKRVEAVNKVAKKEQLQREVKNMDEALATKKKEKIKAIDEELIEMSTGKKPETDAKTKPKKKETKNKEKTVSKKGKTNTKAKEAKQEVGTGEGTQQFFGDVVSGKSKKYIPSKPYKYESKFEGETKTFQESYDKKKGNFDEHIATSIPTFRDTQVKKGSAIVDIYKDQEGGAVMYDLGGSEGGFNKTITEQSGGNIETVNLDPSPEMQKAFNKNKPEGSEMVLEAFGKGWEGVPTHKPSKKADVVHESMMFQFIEDGGERASKIKEVKDKYLKDDGVFITEQKFKGDKNYDQNEQIKNTQHKNKYFTEEQINTKGEEVLVGMSENQADINQYIKELKENFKYVETYWKAGNFSGLIATDNKGKLDQFMESIGDTSNKYSYDTKTLYPVKVKGSPRGNFINVELKIGKTDESISKLDVTKSLPKGVEVIDSGVKGGTLSLELSRPLTKREMSRLLKNTKQLAIPQLKNGEGIMYGSKDWGEFTPEFFNLPNNTKLNEQVKEEPTVGTPKNTKTEGTKGVKQKGTDISDDGNVQESKDIKEKAKEVAAKIRKAKFNSSAKDAMSKLKSTPTGVFEVAWDGAVETVAKTIEVTGDIALGIQKGLAQLKRTKWYQGLSDNGKRMAERKFSDFFRDEIQLSDVAKKQSKGSKIVQKTGQKFVDVFTNINAAIKDLEGAKEFYKKQGLFESKSAHKVNSMLDGVIKAVKKISKSNNTVQQVSDYMYAKHALERNKHVVENVDEENPFGSGLTDSEANFIIDQYDATEKAELEKLAKPFYDLIEDSRNIMVETGLMSQDAMDNLTSTNDTYVPLTGFADEQIELGAQIVQGKAVTVKGKEFRGVTGRTTEAGNIISNIIKQYTDVAIRGSKNEMLQEFDNIKKSNDPDALPYKVYTKETLPKSKGLNTKGKVSYAKAPAQIDETYVGFKVDGQQKYVKFNNPVLAQNLNRSTDAVIDGFTKTAGKLNRFLSASFTQYNPAFMIPNFFRDLQTGLINLKAQADLNEDLNGKDLSAKAAKGVLKAIKTIHADERGGTPKGKFAEYYQEFKEEGAKTGWANKMSLKDITSKVKSMEKLFSTTHTFDRTTVEKGWNAFKDVVDNANTAVENGIRLSTYVAAREAGVSKLDAASLAKELTINFNRRGEIGGLMNTLYLFFNASVQGVNTFAKNMLTFKTYTDSQGNKKRTLNRGQKAALAVQVISGMLTMYNMSISAEDDESGMDIYDSIPDYEKERNLIIMKPNGKDYFKIPLPYGYNIFSNLGTMATEVAFGSRKIEDAVDFTLGSIVGSYLPFSTPEGDFTRKATYSATPTIFTPMFMLSENKDFFGSQIYRENFPTSKDKMATSHLGSKNTPEWYKKSAVLLNSVSGGNTFEEGALNFHPDKAEFLVDYFGGGALKFMKDTYGVAEKGYYKAKGTDISIDPRRVPLLNKVYGKDTHFPEMNLFYTVQENYKRKLNHLKESKEDPKEKVALMRLDALYKVTDKKLKLVRDKEKKVLELKDTSSKLEGLEQIELKKKKVYSEHVKKYLKLKEKLKGDYE